MSKCPECGLEAHLAALFEGHTRELGAENKIVGRMRSYDRGRRGAWGLMLFLLVFLVAMLMSPVLASALADPLWMSILFNSIIFWGLLGYISHLRFQHATTIERYRGFMAERVRAESSR